MPCLSIYKEIFLNSFILYNKLLLNIEYEMIYRPILMGNGMLRNTFENFPYLWDRKSFFKDKIRFLYCVRSNKISKQSYTNLFCVLHFYIGHDYNTGTRNQHRM